MEWRLFPEGTIPECTTYEWYQGRDRAPHLEQPGHRERLLHTAEVIEWLHGERNDIYSVMDLGCGDGGLLSILPGLLASHAWGYDASPTAIAGARERGVEAYQLDVVSNIDEGFLGGMSRWGDLVLTTEMLEHQVDPHGILRSVRRKAKYMVASSPFNENDRGHYEFHTWAWDMAGYKAMFEGAGWRVLRHDTVQSFQVLAAEAAE